jgi:tetratricopeptide (TPR) repeat protein
MSRERRRPVEAYGIVAPSMGCVGPNPGHRAARLAALAVVVAASVLAPSAARAEPRPKQPSVQLFDEARVLYERGEYRGAIVKLEAALALDPRAKELVYNLALVHEKLGELALAERYYREYLELEPDAKQRERVQGILRRLGGAKKEVAVAPAPAPGATPSSTAAPPSTPGARATGPSPWTYVAAGTAVGALAVGIGFGASALAMNPGEGGVTGHGVTYRGLADDAEAAHRRAILADVSFAIASVVGAAAVYLAVTTPRAGSTSALAPRAVALGVGPARASLEVRF